MSVTFSQSTAPTKGLTNYSVEPGAKELYPAPDAPIAAKRRRRAANRLRLLLRGMKKGHPIMDTTIEAMVGTLSKSVATIMDSGDDNKGDLLKQTFGEFSAALKGEVAGQLAKAAPVSSAGEEPLFKGLGAIGRVADLVSTVANRVQAIKLGHDTWCKPADLDPASIDPASPELAGALDGLLRHTELIMREVVNEHVDPLDEGEDPNAPHVIYVPVEGGKVAVKSDLPKELAKFATDPAAIDDAYYNLGMDILVVSGIDEIALTKALSGEGLAKFDPTDPGAGGDPADATGNAGGALPDMGQDQDPLDVLGQIAALLLVQIDHIKQMVNGTDSGSDPTGEGDGTTTTDNGEDPNAGGDPAAAGAGEADNVAAKAAATGALAKGVVAKVDGLDDDGLVKALSARGIDLEALQKVATSNVDLVARLAEYETLVPQLLRKAEAPKAVLVGAAVEKGAESIGGETAPAAQDLSKLEGGDRQLALLKGIHQKGGMPVR